jgi:hypothetical protein
MHTPTNGVENEFSIDETYKSASKKGSEVRRLMKLFRLQFKVEDRKAPNGVPDFFATNNNESKLEAKIKTNAVYSEIMRLPHLILRLCGMYHKSSDNKLAKAYSALVSLILWFNALKLIYWFDSINGTGADVFNAFMVFKIVFIIWSYMCAISSSLLFFMQKNKDHIEKFEALFNSLFACERFPRQTLKEQKKFSHIMFGFLLLNAVAELVIFLVGLFSTGVFFEAVCGLSIFYTPEQFESTSGIYRVFAWVVFSYTFFAWLFPFGFYLIHCNMLMRLIKNFNDAFRDFANNNEKWQLPSMANVNVNTFSDEMYFNELFEWYLSLKKINRVMDACFRKFIAIAFIFYFPIILLLLYVIANWSGSCIEGIMNILYPFWLVSCIVILSWIIITSSNILIAVSVFENSFLNFFSSVFVLFEDAFAFKVYIQCKNRKIHNANVKQGLHTVFLPFH